MVADLCLPTRRPRFPCGGQSQDHARGDECASRRLEKEGLSEPSIEEEEVPPSLVGDVAQDM
jgi:hypothetical protein